MQRGDPHDRLPEVYGGHGGVPGEAQVGVSHGDDRFYGTFQGICDSHVYTFTALVLVNMVSLGNDTTRCARSSS